MSKPIVHLFCNAHLDPVWMWGWEEGAREAVSTFRTAVDLLDEYPEFVFNHNESLLYEWVEEYDPPLFERIKAHVKSGRWNITGGWYLQPDLNIPGGETLVRVILEGRRYFAEKFDVRPPVSYNFDSFGHPGSLPQLLAQGGFDLYVHCRPTDQQIDLPNPLYRWESFDGSQVVSIRPDSGWYCTPGDGQAQEQARNGVAIARRTGQDVLVTWGLGDHGGGATRHDLNLFRELIEQYDDVEIRHSTPEAYLGRVRDVAADLPVHHGETQRTLAGTYTSVAPIKREMREGEALLASAERWAALAWWRYGYAYPHDDLRMAWKRLMFNTFHDVLCGSLLEDALPGVHDMYGYAHDVARRIIVKSQHAVIPAVGPTRGTVPVYVLNPHSSPMRGAIGLNFLAEYRPPPQPKTFTLYDDQGQQISHQDNGGRSKVLENNTWQPYVEFIADVPPMTARRYEIRFEDQPVPSGGQLSHIEDDEGITVENQWWRMRFSRELAAPVELIEKASGRNLLKGPVQMQAMDDTVHAWGGENRAVFNQPVGTLTALSPEGIGMYYGKQGAPGEALRVHGHGPVSITVECLVGWEYTRAALKFKLYADLPYIDIDTRLYMQARRKMLKFTLPFDLPGTRAFCEVPYGLTERPADATEWPCARWVRLENENMTVGIANNGQSGFDVAEDGTLNLSITRGAIHCAWDEPPEGLDITQSHTWMDQTQIDTRFRLLAGASDAETTAALIPAALELNQPLERFFVYYPPSSPTDAPAAPQSLLQVEPATVILGALKKAEEEDALIIRLFESAGQATEATLTLEGIEPQTVLFKPHEIKSFIVGRSGQWRPCNILEEANL